MDKCKLVDMLSEYSYIAITKNCPTFHESKEMYKDKIAYAFEHETEVFILEQTKWYIDQILNSI